LIYIDQTAKKSSSSGRTQSARPAPDMKLSAPSSGIRALVGLPKDDPLPKPPAPGVKGGLKPLLGALAVGVVLLELPPAVELQAETISTC
jgi:hypothetical protein